MIANVKNSVTLGVPSVALCVTKNKNYTELHRGTQRYTEKKFRPFVAKKIIEKSYKYMIANIKKVSVLCSAKKLSRRIR